MIRHDTISEGILGFSSLFSWPLGVSANVFSYGLCAVGMNITGEGVVVRRCVGLSSYCAVTLCTKVVLELDRR